MRKIQFKDVMTLSKILKKTNMKDELVSVFEKAKKTATNKKVKETDLQQIGMDIIFLLLESAGDAEDLIYKLLDDIFETDKLNKSVKEMNIDEVITYIMQLAKENDLASFFKSAGKLTN